MCNISLVLIALFCAANISTAQVDTVKSVSFGLDVLIPEIIVSPDPYRHIEYTSDYARSTHRYKYSTEFGFSVNHMINKRMALEYRFANKVVVSEETFETKPVLAPWDTVGFNQYSQHFFTVQLGTQVNFAVKKNPYYSFVLNGGVRTLAGGKSTINDYLNSEQSEQKISSNSTGNFHFESGLMLNLTLKKSLMIRFGVLVMNAPSPIVVSDMWSLRMPLSIRYKF